MPTPRLRDRNEALLIELLFNVNRARAEVRVGRTVPATSTNRHDQQQRRALLADAMEAYADAREFRSLTGTATRCGSTDQWQGREGTPAAHRMVDSRQADEWGSRWD